MSDESSLENVKTRNVVNQSELPLNWPTHEHSVEFWEELGRTVGTFGRLEDTLGKAIFAFGATREYETEAEALAACEAWLPTLNLALSGTLNPLADVFKKAVDENSNATIRNVGELVTDIKEAAVLRNVICHGSWQLPDSDGRSLPYYVRRNGQVFDTKIDVPYLRQLRDFIVKIICAVIDCVTHMGYQFPGGAGPGSQILGGFSGD